MVDSGVWLFTVSATASGIILVGHGVMLAASVILTQRYRRKKLLWDDSHFLTSDALWDNNVSKRRQVRQL